jgi:hypothetical protein
VRRPVPGCLGIAGAVKTVQEYSSAFTTCETSRSLWELFNSRLFLGQCRIHPTQIPLPSGVGAAITGSLALLMALESVSDSLVLDID